MNSPAQSAYRLNFGYVTLNRAAAQDWANQRKIAQADLA
jgi:hypothetical protein